MIKWASEYDFEVFPVETCPQSNEEWNVRSNVQKCNKTHGYHCVPNKHLTSLIEFCYPGGVRLPFEGGNCLELAARGILNQIPCKQTFQNGCPDNFFFSQDLYKYPKCLSINTELRCFDADVECIFSRVLEEKASKQNNTTTEKNTAEKDAHIIVSNESSAALTAVIISIVVINIFALLIGLYFWKSEKLCFQKHTHKHLEETEMLHPFSRNAATKHKICIEKPLNRNGIDVDLDELDSEHLVEDMDQVLLLRRHCLDGAYENFKYLLFKNILGKEDQSLLSILQSRDKMGSSLLHYSAEGGSKDILETLLKYCPELNVDDTNHFGHTVLHLACKRGRYSLCTFLLSSEKYSRLLLTKSCHNLWNAAHFTAVNGDIKIFRLLHGKGEIDMKAETRNGLNILDIACINKKTDFCMELVNTNNELNLFFEKSDPRGWTIAHFAAKTGNKNIFNLFISNKFTSSKTHRGKTILHICCEYGHYDLCELIVKKSPFIGQILHDIDGEGWNVLHSAAKGGNLEVFKLIEKSLKSSDPLEILCKETFNRKTVLHICCIHKHVDICKYICQKLKSTPQKLNKVNDKLWTAAHYVAVEIQQNGKEEELIRILVEAGLDLKAKSDEGKTVLTVACEHRNKTLVNYLLHHHPELLKIETAKLREVAGFDDDIEANIHNALQELN
uniref:Uncharacterized protein LOC111106580 isoform X2 n=1 Tax=Crassostrea virginica TaxID=6565 RepID=A0A8B8B304_CRAVI|nr:uncharacterized protein LOC111106580 isoform X2 [Crassostrea virginica]